MTQSQKIYKRVLPAAILLLGGLCMSSCNKFEYHPYQGKFEGEKHLTSSNLRWLEKLELGNNYKFAFISDTQRRYDETKDVVKDLNQRDEIDFVLHGGDMTDFGLTNEFVWMRDCLLKLNKPWLTVIGNHDFLGNGEHIYEEMFGQLNYSFTIGHVRFEALNTVALELDYSTPVPDFDFLEKELIYINDVNKQHPDSIQRTIFLMHSRPGDEQFNNNVMKPFKRYLEYFPNPVCFNGHNHRNEILDPFECGILFYGVTDISDRQYYIVTIHDDSSYDVKTIDF
ncbi:MAG: metallophosphoesterase [Bacteroidales bacterium]|nr:metallophosphoesterase [Bacteroidales bacterium]